MVISWILGHEGSSSSPFLFFSAYYLLLLLLLRGSAAGYKNVQFQTIGQSAHCQGCAFYCTCLHRNREEIKKSAQFGASYVTYLTFISVLMCQK